MIRIHMTADDLAATRFAYSPLIELALSYGVYRNPTLHNYFRYWIEDAQQSLYGLSFPYLTALTQSTHYIPDFLTPTPMHTRLTIEDEIEKLRGTSHELIRDNIHKLIDVGVEESAVLHHFLSHPYEAIEILIDELRVYWQRVLAEHWSRITTVFEGDMLYHGRMMALEGAPTVFSGLDDKLRYHDGQIVVNKRKAHEEVYLDGGGLQLVPTMFGNCPQGIMFQVNTDWHPMLIYGVRGVGLWRQRHDDAPNRSLELALGAGRARVLQSLLTPTNTSELAQQLQITSAAVSQHLSRLNNAGLVEPQRSGRRVFYHLTHRGAELLTLFDAN